MDNSIKKNLSELRFDLESKDWVMIATGRAKKPEDIKLEEKTDGEKHKKETKKKCPFCSLHVTIASNMSDRPVLAFSQGEKIERSLSLSKNWTLMVIPNKFPAVAPGESLRERAEGPYSLMDGVGFHEVVVTKDHLHDMSQLSVAEIKEVFDAYQERYLELMNEKFVKYVSIFHNHGHLAGATITHPHSQIMAIPVTDPDVQKSLIGSKRYYDFHQKCLHCEMLRWDKEAGDRIVFENNEFIALCPFASRAAFHLRIYPKKHLSYFERATDEQKIALAEAFHNVLSRLRKTLGDLAYNFFLRTSPCDGRDHSYYHWHFEIIPRTSIQAGFELGAGIEISIIEPGKAAEYLRKI
jgi:UDPglucose--hexose-1-phosphate uridylyltransferase